MTDYETETKGHILGSHQGWVRNIYDAPQAYRQGSLPKRIRGTGLPHESQICEYEELIIASAVYTKERIRSNFLISRAYPNSVQVRIN